MRSPERLGVLDGLRAIAVLLVLSGHLWDWTGEYKFPLDFIFSSGGMGVDLFYFLSGFVIAYPFIRANLGGGRRPTWRHFYLRRGLKILPSYWLCLAVAFATGYAALHIGIDWPQDLASHLLFVHNFIAPEWGAINSVMWTLGNEVQFYALFPALWAVFSRWPYPTAGATIAAALAWRIASIHLAPTGFAFGHMERSLIGYLDVFMAGILVAYVWVRYQPRSPYAPAWALLAVACVLELFYSLCLVSCGRSPTYVFGWEVYARTPMALAFGGVALGFLASPRWWQALLDNRVLRFVAVISYNFYLYQLLVLDHFRGYSSNGPLFIALVCGSLLVIATVVTYAFERPLLRWKHG